MMHRSRSTMQSRPPKTLFSTRPSISMPTIPIIDGDRAHRRCRHLCHDRKVAVLPSLQMAAIPIHRLPTSMASTRSTTRSRTAALTDTGTLTITVTTVNDAPVAIDDAVTATEDTVFNSAIDLDANDTDLDGDALSGRCRYVRHHSGRQYHDCCRWQLHLHARRPISTASTPSTIRSPTAALTDTATLTITVDPVNDAPVAVDDVGNGNGRYRLQLGHRPRCERHGPGW